LGTLIISFLLAFYLRFNSLEMTTEWKRLIVFLGLQNVLINLIVNPYSGIFQRRYYKDLGQSLLVEMTNAAFAVLFFYVFKLGADYSRGVMIMLFFFHYIISVAVKYLWKKLQLSGKLRIHNIDRTTLFLICKKENAESDVHSIYSTDMPLYDIRGIYLLPDGTDSVSSINYKAHKESIDVPVIKNEIVKFVLTNNIDEVMVCVPPEEIDKDIYQELIKNGVVIDLAVESLLGIQTEQQGVAHIGVNKVLSLETFSFSAHQQAYLSFKRLFDIICGLIGLILLIPVSLFVKIAYLISGDTAGIIYKQKRVGLNGKQIEIFKFRSMIPNADVTLEEMLKEEHYRKEWNESQKFENDPRITKVGKFLRKTSIDELPQLINVLLGDMSIVGPRPLISGELDKFGGLMLYQKVKPGITGWWACNGRSNINYDERLELEYYYVKHCSLYLDALCILRTMVAVMKREGAA
jgi:undecaprenyl-phosphate galactose phosphotransferase